MNIQRVSKWIALLLLLCASSVWAERFDNRDLEVEIINDRGRSFPYYPMRRNSSPVVYKAYLEAVRDINYGIRVRNRSNERIGLVIAVDGRNIINGDYSKLRSTERMYVLDPGKEETYEGWRTGRDRVNRFYFTEAGDSYASSWGDTSAMGVIAVAAFREAVSYPPPRSQEERDNRHRESTAPMAGRNSAAPPSAAPQSSERQAAPGTGYGDSQWSPSRRVEFEAESRPFAKFFFKYVWRDTLCREGIIDCGSERPRGGNRFWDEQRDRDNRDRDERDDYAPPPRR